MWEAKRKRKRSKQRGKAGKKGNSIGGHRIEQVDATVYSASALAAADLVREVTGEEEDVGVREEGEHSVGLPHGVEVASGV